MHVKWTPPVVEREGGSGNGRWAGCARLPSEWMADDGQFRVCPPLPLLPGSGHAVRWQRRPVTGGDGYGDGRVLNDRINKSRLIYGYTAGSSTFLQTGRLLHQISRYSKAVDTRSAGTYDPSDQGGAYFNV